ncbi:Monooxygenase, partial [Thalictrum thalictroides]
MEIEEDVVIVGAGIAGLATALALKRVGVRALVLEKSDTLRATGAALTISQNAWLALDSLGVANKLSSVYPPFQKGYITSVTTGDVREITFIGIDKGVTGPRTLHRCTLLETLAQELLIDAIRFSSKLSSIKTLKHDEGSSVAVLTLEDGSIIKAKIVIGCDGVHSVVAQWLGLATPIHSGRFAVRGVSVYPQGHGLKHEVQQFLHGSIRAGLAPLNSKEIYWFVTYGSIPNRDEGTRNESPELMQKKLLENISNFPEVYLDVVRHCDLQTLTWSPLMLRVPWDFMLKHLSTENITVAGDAMHPMTPDLGQGGCAALEDAIVLGRHIGNSFIQNGKILPGEVLKGYVKERRWRVAVLITVSYLSGWFQQEGST